MANYTNRVVLLIDMDCFYCQVEESLDPNLKGKPIAVVQYNEWRGGGIIAVNYPARDRGVTRHMRGDDAKEKCPEINLVKVPQIRGKADLSKYRDAGNKVAQVLQNFTPFLERASVDEAYLDITKAVQDRISNNKNLEISSEKLSNTFVVGMCTADFITNLSLNKELNESNYKLAVGGVIAEEIRAEVFKVTGYKCSAGIAHNKILAKLVCGLHKPNKQTIIPHESIQQLFENLRLDKIKGLGGKFGTTVSQKLGIVNVGELTKFSQKELSKFFDEKTSLWLYNIAQGIDTDPVTTKLISKSIGCCKRFPGKTALLTEESIKHWLNELSDEIAERLHKDLKENNRKARQMVVSFTQEINGEEVSSTRTYPLNSYEQLKIFENAFKIIEKNCCRKDGSYDVRFLGISTGNFEDIKKVKEITSFFKSTSDSKSNKRKILEAAITESEKSISGFSESLNTCNNKVQQKYFKSEKYSNEEIHYGSKNFDVNNFHGPETVSICKNTFFKENVCDSSFKILGGCSDILIANSSQMDLPTQENSNLDKDNSVYSLDTQPDLENLKNLVYYDQVCPESIEDQNFPFEVLKDSSHVSNLSKDSISQEIVQEELNDTNEEMTSPLCSPSSKSTSFFSKYVNDKISRDFNTAKVLKLTEDENVETLSLGHFTQLENFDIEHNKKLEESNNSAEQQTRYLDNYKKTCPDCGKDVLVENYQSHLDYHFALSIVKQESHLYKEEQPFRKSNSPKHKSKSSKKIEKQKIRGTEKKANSLVNFLQNTDLTNDDFAKECSECRKKISLLEFNVHLDFHLAQKLHRQINSERNESTNHKIKDTKAVTKSNGQKDIASFFKKS